MFFSNSTSFSIANPSEEIIDKVLNDDILWKLNHPTQEFTQFIGSNISTFLYSALFLEESIDHQFYVKCLSILSSKSKDILMTFFDDTKFWSLISYFPLRAAEVSAHSRGVYCKILEHLVLFSDFEFLQRCIPKRVIFMKNLISNINYLCFYDFLTNLIIDQRFYSFFENIRLSKLLVTEFIETYENRERVLTLMTVLVNRLNVSSPLLQTLYSKNLISLLISFAISSKTAKNASKNAFLLLNSLYNHKFGVAPRVIEQINKTLPNLCVFIKQNIHDNFICNVDASIQLLCSIIKSVFSTKDYIVTGELPNGTTTPSSVSITSPASHLLSTGNTINEFKHHRSLSHPESQMLDRFKSDHVFSTAKDSCFSQFGETANFSLLSVVRSYPTFDLANSPCFTIMEEEEQPKAPQAPAPTYTNSDVLLIKDLSVAFTDAFFSNHINSFLHSSYLKFLRVIAEYTPFFKKIVKKCKIVEKIVESPKEMENGEATFWGHVFKISQLIRQESFSLNDINWHEFINGIVIEEEKLYSSYGGEAKHDFVHRQLQSESKPLP